MMLPKEDFKGYTAKATRVSSDILFEKLDRDILIADWQYCFHDGTWKTSPVFKEKGFDILVRDASCLGFPTYQVIIPGYSETTLYRLSPTNKEDRFSPATAKVLKKPQNATFDELLAFLLDYSENKNKDFTSRVNLPLDLSCSENNFLMAATMAYVQYQLGRVNEAKKYINKMLEFTDEADVDTQNKLICLKR